MGHLGAIWDQLEAIFGSKRLKQAYSRQQAPRSKKQEQQQAAPAAAAAAAAAAAGSKQATSSKQQAASSRQQAAGKQHRPGGMREAVKSAAPFAEGWQGVLNKLQILSKFFKFREDWRPAFRRAIPGD